MRVSAILLAVLMMKASDIDERLAKWQPVKMSFDGSGLRPRERQIVQKLVEASQYLDNIYWRQADPEALTLYKSTQDPKLRRLLMIHGSRFDLIDENHPFTGSEPASPGWGLYPKGLTREEIEQYVKQHPEKKEELYSPYTIVERRGGELVGRPYHEVYRPFLEPAAKALREAAGLSDDAAFAEFLRQRADALLVDDYFKSDLLWMDLKDPKFDVIFAPYETYLDEVLGVIVYKRNCCFGKIAAVERYNWLSRGHVRMTRDRNVIDRLSISVVNLVTRPSFRHARNETQVVSLQGNSEQRLGK